MGAFISVYGYVKPSHCKAVTVALLHSKWPHEHSEARCGGNEGEKEPNLVLSHATSIKKTYVQFLIQSQKDLKVKHLNTQIHVGMYLLLLGARSVRRKVLEYLYGSVPSLFWGLFPHCLIKDELSSGTRGVMNINLYTFKNHPDTASHTNICIEL